MFSRTAVSKGQPQDPEHFEVYASRWIRRVIDSHGHQQHLRSGPGVRLRICGVFLSSRSIFGDRNIFQGQYRWCRWRGVRTFGQVIDGSGMFQCMCALIIDMISDGCRRLREERDSASCISPRPQLNSRTVSAFWTVLPYLRRRLRRCGAICWSCDIGVVRTAAGVAFST